MFTINYNISDEYKHLLSTIHHESFETDYGDIEGQFELIFNGYHQGYIDDSIPYGYELLISWFKILNDSSIKLCDNDYVAFSILETDEYWIQMETIGDFINIKKMKDTISKRDVTELIVTSRFKEFIEWDWQGITIPKTAFITEVKKKTKLFLHEVTQINRNLLKSKCLHDLLLSNLKL